MPTAMLPSRLARMMPLGRFALAYGFSLAFGLLLSRFDRGVAVIWLAGAVLFVQLVITPRRRWTGVMLVALPCGMAAIALFGFGRMAALPLGLIGVVEAWAAAALVKRVCPRFGRLQSIDEVFRFLLVAGLVVPALGAGPAGWVIHQIAGIPLARACADWFAAHALGFIVFSPPILLARRGEARRWLQSASAGLKREAALWLGGVGIASAISFGQSVVPLVLLPFIVTVAATLRLGRFGAMASVVILMTIGLIGTSAGLGPTQLLHVSNWVRFEVLQGYFASVVLVLLPLATELVARQRLLERVQVAEALHRLIIERSSDVILRVRHDGTVSFASPSVVRLWGFLPEDVVGRSVFDLIHPRDAPKLRANRRALMDSKDSFGTIEFRTVCKDGTDLWVEGSSRAMLDHHGRVNGTLTVIREVAERRAMIDNPTLLAMTDPMTGLANRRVFDLDLVRGLASGQSGCLALFDLDHFKQINAVHGQAAGDQVIQTFAQVLRESVRSGDNAVRLGGEAFAVLLFGATVEDARQICQRIVTRFAASEDIPADAAGVRATVSAGLARFATGTSPEGVMTAADTALYHAKNGGRNRLSVAA